MFSALDNALSQKAQDTLTEFAAVKKADIQLQTQLGNRKGQIAANVIGAFAESQSSAFGWQVRVFGAEDGGKGANVGVFYRNIADYTKIGINSFVDYEDGDYGEFYRASIGGEISTSEYSFAANYYLPITDDKRGGGKVAFSQKGYDANLRINIPQMDYLKVRGDYYYFDGKYGGEDDKGFRYGLEVQPINDLRIGVFYDDGGEKFGGDIVYAYNFGIPQKRESKVAFSPDLFAPVLREYSQRIVSTTTLQIVEVPTLTLFTTTTIPARVQRTTLGLGFITVSMPITVATATITDSTTMFGMTTTTRNVIMTMTATRMASVHFTARIGHFEFFPNGQRTDLTLLVTTNRKVLVSLPPLPITRPLVITTNSRLSRVSGGVAQRDFNSLEATLGIITVGQTMRLDSNIESRTLTIVQGSEDFISVATTLTTETEMTAADVITHTTMTLSAATITRMTNTLMPTLTLTMTISAMMITMPTLTLYQTITAGIPTTNTGAAKVDSHSPPSFPRPQLSFPRRRESTLRKAQTTAAAKPPLIRWRKAPSAFAALRRVDSRLRGNDKVKS